jgi:pimeloyl-ACP methyl ester carboxylesterase
MTMTVRSSTLMSVDGTRIAYQSFGEGPGIVIVGGALRSANDYLAFGRELQGSMQVHLMDRRGRGGSGPQGGDYCIEKECEDLLSLIAATGAARVFGHSYGGLVALETTKRSRALERVAVWEPGVSINGAIPIDWMRGYEARLQEGDRRGAFAWMVQHSGYAPKVTAKLPRGLLRAALRVAIRDPEWNHMEPLLEANLAEHRQVARLDSDGAGYAAIASSVLLMGGGKSPDFVAEGLKTLNRMIDGSSLAIVAGLGHEAPEGKASHAVAEQVLRFMQGEWATELDIAPREST